MNTPRAYLVTAQAAGQRLDVWLLAQLGDGHSRAEVQRYIKAGALKLGPSPSLNPAKKVRVGEEFAFTLPQSPGFNLKPEAIPLDIIYEDEVLLVINKAAGQTVHPAPGNHTGTLVHALLHHCGTHLSTENGAERPGIVHRLDKDTSGLLVVAKGAQAHRHLARQFAAHGRDGRLHRKYLALVRGAPFKPSGTIAGNIGRHPTLRIPRAVVKEGGKTAVTHYTTLQTFGLSNQKPTASLLALQLETGRTHQIRVHLAHIGCPVLGDPLYPTPRGNLGPLAGCAAQVSVPKGQMLHAAELGFIHPQTQQKLRFEAPPPPPMQSLIDSLSICYK